MTEPSRCWLLSATLEQVETWHGGGYVATNPTATTRLSRLETGDRLACWTSRVRFELTGGGSRVRRGVTGLGTVTGAAPVRTPTGWRLDVAWADVVVVPLDPLLPVLGWHTDDEGWGESLRPGLREVTTTDLAAIAGAMRDAALDESERRTGSGPS